MNLRVRDYFATVNPTVFTASSIMVVSFVVFGVVFTETAASGSPASTR